MAAAHFLDGNGRWIVKDSDTYSCILVFFLVNVSMKYLTMGGR